MKTKYLALIALAIFALAFTACKDEPENNPPPPKPIEVTFNVPDECTNLNKTKPITILFPATFTTARMDNIKGKFVDSMAGLEERAGKSSEFKTKINAILDRGLTITINETDSPLSNRFEVVDSQLVVGSAYIEHSGVSSGNVAATIIWLINNGDLQ